MRLASPLLYVPYGKGRELSRDRILERSGRSGSHGERPFQPVLGRPVEGR